MILGIFITAGQSRLLMKWQEEKDKTIFLASFVLFRIIPWLAIFFVAGEAYRGDIPFFFGKAEGALKGGFVYRDFWSYHAPLFSYIIAVPVWIWHDPKAIGLFMVLAEAAILWLTYKTYKEKNKNALMLSVIYFLLPAGFVNTLIGGQEEVWFWGAALLMWRLTIRKPENFETGLGVLFALTLISIKITFIFFILPLLIVVKRPFRMLAAAMAIGILVIAFLYFKIGTLFLMPIQHTSQFMTPNLFSVIRPFSELVFHIDDKNSTLVNWFGLLFTVFIPALIAFKVRNKPVRDTLPDLFIITFSCMMIFQASAVGAYLIAYVMAVVFEIIDFRKKADMIIFMLINLLAVVQPFVWVYIGQPTYVSFSLLSDTAYLFEYTLQFLSVAGFFWILFKSWRHVRASVR